jgi:hypothetical protein
MLIYTLMFTVQGAEKVSVTTAIQTLNLRVV